MGEDGGNGFCFGGIEIPRSSISDKGVVCPLCKIFQKKVMSHIKKVHGENHDFTLEKEFRKYMSKLRQEKPRAPKKERGPIGFAESQREEQDKSRVAKKDCGRGQLSRAGRGSMRRNAPEHGIKERLSRRDYARKEREEKERQRATRQGRQRQHGEECTGTRHQGENAWTNLPLSFPPEHDIKGPTIPCYFCHTYKFRDEVVPLTAEQIAEIEKRERQTREENEEKNRRRCEEYLRERYEGQNQEDSEPDEHYETESDLEEEVNWDLVKPDNVVQWALHNRKVYEEIRERIDWTLDKGTRPEERETRRSLKMFREDLDYDWQLMRKYMLKGSEDMTLSDCEDEGHKEFVNEVAADFQAKLESAHTNFLLKRLCYSCHNP